MEELLQPIVSSPELINLAEQLRKPGQGLTVFLPGSAQALVVGCLARWLGRMVVLVRADDEQVKAAFGDVAGFFPTLRVARRGRNDGDIMVATLMELAAPQPVTDDAAVLRLKVGERLEPTGLVGWLEEKGYERTDLVTEPGEYAARGCIVDIFPEPEYPQEAETGEPFRIEFADDRVVSLRRFDRLTQRSVQSVESVSIVPRRQALPAGPPVWQLLPEDVVVVVEERLTEGASWLATKSRLLVTEFWDESIDLGFRPANSYLGRIEVLRQEIAAAGSDFFIVCRNEESCERLKGVVGPGPRYVVARLSQGFVFEPARITVLTEQEILGMPMFRQPRRRFKGLPVDSLVTLRPGDYVVHVDYGVGVFAGIRRMCHEGVEKDFVVVQFAGNDRVYVPVENLGLLDRFVGSEERPPKLDRIGSRSWLWAKARAARASEEFASELLKIQAQRVMARQEPFPPDNQEQLELEASFPFEETPDQLRALSEVKRDMMRSQPMDRLLCGDVGFGKTEVALRAAFKAAMSLRQVAFLVPTTILCYQHFQTFRKRLAPFPLRVEMLSRFVSPEKRREVIEGLRTGQVDIVVGTHLLLSPRIRFRDLGLVVVDEEQRFGVRQKERLRALRTSVSVLTLTATPIPRTLYMALAGLRDISVLNTPIPGRKEIVTEVSEWNDELIREFVEREVSRGGQVFFVHNEIQTIGMVAKRLARLLPGVKLAIAHGRMPGRRLAECYLAFAGGEFQVLLSTAIIESGLDMPNVNTIIVNRADRFGLADLHQLRGRVGRTERQGFALFLIPGRREITVEARKRLSALLAYARLGSGYRLALRDMEIRGAGNILGTEQHGHIARVGFNLWTQMLREAVAKLKGEAVPAEPELNLEISGFIPKDYIGDAYERIAIYRRLLGVESEEELSELRSELVDRFGRYPPVVENLFQVGLVRVRSRRLGLLKVTLKNGVATIVSQDRTTTVTGGIAELLESLQSGIG
ncbi:MAG: transcription-repair coupling factor [candidate division WOR-3 bacterium]